VIVEWFHPRGEARKDQSAFARYLQLPQSVLFKFESFGHSSLALDAATKGNGDEVAFKVVLPMMIGEDQRLSVAPPLAAKLGSAVRATVLKNVYFALFPAHDNYRTRTYLCTPEVARPWNFDLEAD